jgi:hypothetical protein
MCFDENHAAKAVSISISTACSKSHNGHYYFQFFNDLSQSYLMWTPEILILMLGQHVLQYMHQFTGIYLITRYKWFTLSFIHFPSFSVKLRPVHNIILSAELIYNSRLKTHSSTSAYNLSLLTKVDEVKFDICSHQT